MHFLKERDTWGGQPPNHVPLPDCAPNWEQSVLQGRWKQHSGLNFDRATDQLLPPELSIKRSQPA